VTGFCKGVRWKFLTRTTFAGADIIGGLSTPTMNESEKEQREQSRRIMVIIESQHIQLQAQHDALLLLLQNRHAKDASERSGENAKSKNYAHVP
jgi:hypothetical protein